MIEAEPALLPTLRRLRARMLEQSAADLPEPAAGSWRDDLRLFLVAWAAGFLFFLVLIA